MYANIYALSTAAHTSLDVNTHIPSQDVQLKLLQYFIKFHPDQLNSVQENKVTRFCFVLTLLPLAKLKVFENGVKHGRYEHI